MADVLNHILTSPWRKSTSLKSLLFINKVSAVTHHMRNTSALKMFSYNYAQHYLLIKPHKNFYFSQCHANNTAYESESAIHKIGITFALAYFFYIIIYIMHVDSIRGNEDVKRDFSQIFRKIL